MTDRNIYLKAAKIIDSGSEAYSCWAILEVIGITDGNYLEKSFAPVLKHYIETFNGKRKFDEFIRRVADIIEPGHGWDKTRKELSNFRVLMLLFMAEACDDL